MASALKAVQKSTISAAAQIALSYAHQAAFNLPEALEAAQAAISHAPENGTAWARLAELQLSTGELGLGIKAARKAAELNPHVARAHTILGFAYLTQTKTNMARDTFEKAIVLDSTAPLPRLGLGLAKIRGGYLKQGRADIEIAAGLDPLNALIRSYLGKAYFDEKRGSLYATQLEIAKTLDPNDPTPYFYSAIQKQTENRPVEALQDLRQSIALNDNRAVYRSRLLLDDDLAVRSASLGRIYSDLGFEQLSLVEGWKSVNTDPTNHSAHRFLADSYAALPRHEIARISELLQAQLTQPINITPVSPQLAQSGLFILEGSGPGDLTFNEFHPLFLRNRLALQASGVVGENGTLGEEVVQSGVLGKFSYSLGQFYYETDGFRENNEQRKDIYNAFGQFNVTPATSLQAEYRYNRTQKGDLELTFLETFNPDQDVDDNVETYRFGLRHTFAPNKLLLGSFIYQGAELSTVVAPGIFELEADVDYYVGEINYQTKIADVHFIAGFGHRQKKTTLVTDFFGSPTEEDSETQFNNVYFYSLTELPQNMLLTVGGSGESLNGATDEEDSDQFNPKLGLMWNPYKKTTLRAAVIRTLDRPLLSKENIDPTLELTQVAGFNQFFLGAEGHETWQYGAGIDQVLSKKVFAGAELVFRDVEERFITTSGPTPGVEQYSREDYWLRSYLNWAANSWVTMSIEYLYEYVDREEADDLINIEEFSKLDTHKIPLSIKLFHPSGITAGVKATYVDQKGDFLNPTDASIITDSDQFWVVDASIDYRLPKRYGIINLEAKNLFDEEFNFQDTDPANPEMFPVRSFFLRLTVSF
ncbi:MAG: TonB-dependent receptor [Desulfobacteraceae bacterium]